MVDINQILRGRTGNDESPPAKRGRKHKGGPGETGSAGSADSGTENLAPVGGSEADSGGGSEGSQTQAQAGSVAPENAIGDAAPKQRKARGPNKPKAEAGSNLGIDPKELAPQIQGLHVMLAMMTGQPVFLLSPQECEMLAKNIANVSQHFNIAPSSKGMAIAGLVATCGMIYIPRIASVRRNRVKPEEPSAFPATPDAVQATPKDGRYDFSGNAGNMQH